MRQRRRREFGVRTSLKTVKKIFNTKVIVNRHVKVYACLSACCYGKMLLSFVNVLYREMCIFISKCTTGRVPRLPAGLRKMARRRRTGKFSAFGSQALLGPLGSLQRSSALIAGLRKRANGKFSAGSSAIINHADILDTVQQETFLRSKS